MSSTSQKPLVTTIIPTYRRPQLLKRAILSVINQEFPDFQVCIYDNASGDETARVVAEIAEEDSRVKYYCHPKNIGAVANFNYGMQHVNTPLFSLLSDDNVLLPHFFAQAIEALNVHRDAILFAGQVVMVNENGEKISVSLNEWESGLLSPLDGFLNMLEKGIPNWEAVVLRSEVIKNVGLLDPCFSGSVDQDFMMRIARDLPIYVSKKPYALFVRHPDSWSLNRDLNEVTSTTKKRLEKWLADEELPSFVKLRVQNVINAKIDKVVRNFVCYKSLIGEDNATLKAAVALKNSEVELSLRTLRVIILARIASYNKILRTVLSGTMRYYLQLRLKLVILKNKKFSESTTYDFGALN